MTSEKIKDFPELFINATGEITTHNMPDYGKALADRLAEVRSIVLVTDDDFSNAKEQAKILREQCKKLESVKDAMLKQTLTIGEAATHIDAWIEDSRVTALKLEKDVEREDKAKKTTMLAKAEAEYNAHINSLNAEITPIILAIPTPDFIQAIKGKSKYENMQVSLDDAVIVSKSKADEAAKDIRAKMTWRKESSAGFGFLFSDLSALIANNGMEAFQAIVTSRIEKHKADEAAKMEAQRIAIQMEEERKALAKVQAEEQQRVAAQVNAQRAAEEEARIRQDHAFAEEKRIKEETEMKCRRFASEQEAVAKKARGDDAVVVNCAKPLRATKEAIINAIAVHFQLSISDAENAIISAFF